MKRSRLKIFHKYFHWDGCLSDLQSGEKCIPIVRAMLFTLSFFHSIRNLYRAWSQFRFSFYLSYFLSLFASFLCAFFMVSLLFDGCSSIGRNKNELGKREKRLKMSRSRAWCCTRDKKHKSCFAEQFVWVYVVTCSVLWAITNFVARVELHARYWPKLRNQNGQLTETMDKIA